MATAADEGDVVDNRAHFVVRVKALTPLFHLIFRLLP